MKKKSVLSLIILIVGIILILIGIFYIFINTNNTKQDNNLEETLPNDPNLKETIFEDEQCVDNICLYNLGFSTTNDFQILTFNIINKSETDVTISNITITGLNANGEVVDTFEMEHETTYVANVEDVVYIQYSDKNMEGIESYTFTYN